MGWYMCHRLWTICLLFHTNRGGYNGSCPVVVDHVGGGGKLTRVIVAYQPCSPKNRRMMGETVWDQHLRYFESRGESQDPRSMFHHDHISLLHQWKGAGDEIMLLGDFNKKVYSGSIACSLSLEELCMGKTCQQTTGKMLPATHS